jgi:hypothetical protein
MRVLWIDLDDVCMFIMIYENIKKYQNSLDMYEIPLICVNLELSCDLIWCRKWECYWKMDYTLVVVLKSWDLWLKYDWCCVFGCICLKLEIRFCIYVYFF